MTQMPDTFALGGGLDLVTAPINVMPGYALAGCNYQPDDKGYSRIKGYERFDGKPSPSSIAYNEAILIDGDGAALVDGDGAALTSFDAEEARALIAPVPGIGPVRGVWVYGGHVWAFRDVSETVGGMYKSTSSGWVAVETGWRLNFIDGVSQLREGTTVYGATSGARGEIRRDVLQNGAWDGTASGYLVLYEVEGAFLSGEVITAESGSAVVSTFIRTTIAPGGEYRFVNHNFYGSLDYRRMYFVNGQQAAFEFDGENLHPIETGATGVAEEITPVLERDGDGITLRDGEVVYLRGLFDRPQHIAEFSNHLFLGYPGGSLFFSSVGEPMEFIAVGGAGEIGVGAEITGLVPSASTSLVVFCRSQIRFISGTNATNFVMAAVSNSAGAFPNTAQMMDQPVYLDDGGIRSLSTTQAYGDWRIGAISNMVSPLLESLLNRGLKPVASVKVRQRLQYRLFWADGTGLMVYFGRKRPEVMPFKLGFLPTCLCAGETDETSGKERIFAGASSGYVYEMEAGNSFDGQPVPAFLTLAWHHMKAPRVDKRFFLAEVEIDAPQLVSIGVGFGIEYRRPDQAQGVEFSFLADPGTAMQSGIGDYEQFDWTEPEMGRLTAHLSGIGTNIAMTLRSESTHEAPHIFTAMTINFSPRRARR
jgi:hypothetical protein